MKANMALSVTTFSLVLVCLTLASTSKGGSSREKQFCGDEKFYCPTRTLTDKCLDRKLRCTNSRVCLDFNGNEEKCFEVSTSPGTYNFFKKKSPLSSGSSSKRGLELNHWFVQYRGFAYEFGSYLFQELDVNDPNYKYGPGREKVRSQELVGSSDCTREQVLRFVGRWLQANPKYKLFKSNCQHFAQRLLKELGDGCPDGARRQVDDIESLKAPSDCYNSVGRQDDHAETLKPSQGLTITHWKRRKITCRTGKVLIKWHL